jgi:endonuclease G, mitochondrial
MTRRFLIVLVVVVVLALLGTTIWFARPVVLPPVMKPSVPPSAAQPAVIPGVIPIEPRPRSGSVRVLRYGHFTVGFDEGRGVPAWAQYMLDGPVTVRGSAGKRPSRFKGDDRVVGEPVHDAFTRSGFDRGHLVPNYAIFSRYGEAAAAETFVMTNVVPQRHGVNAGLWEQLEERIAGRDRTGDGWAGRRRNITIINGPIYQPPDEYLPSGVPVPDATFSVVLDYQEETGMYEALAWIIPNQEQVRGSLAEYLVSISRVEIESGLEIDEGIGERLVIPDGLWE